MKKRYIVSISIISIILLIIISTAGFAIFAAQAVELKPVSAEQISDMETALSPVTNQINKDMEAASSAVWKTARELDGLPVDDPAIIIALFKLKRDIPISFEVGLFDTNEVLIASTEDPKISIELGISKATNHYTEEDFKAAGSQCIVSNYSTLRHGDTGITITTALYDAEGNFNGTLRVGIDTWYFFSGITESLRNQYGYTLWVTQDNGLVIFDQDIEEIGHNMFTDNLYATDSLQNAARCIIDHPSGNTSYLFYDPYWLNTTQTNAVWNTVDPGYDIVWRIVLTDNAIKPENASTIIQIPKEVKAFVEKAYVYAIKEGKEKALATFNDPDGEFVDGEHSIFAYSMDGEILAEPLQPDSVGHDRWFMEDTNGVKTVQRVIARAEQGGGYVFYMYPNPKHKYAQEYKLSYVMMVDNEWLIGSSIYIHENPLTQPHYNEWKVSDDLRYQVRDIQYLTKAEGIPGVIEMIKNSESDLQVDGSYPFVLTEDGTILAYVLKPSMENTNQLGLTNLLGMSVIREIISLAQAGGGVMYYIAEIPPENEEHHVLIYVEPADTTTYAGSLIVLA